MTNPEETAPRLASPSCAFCQLLDGETYHDSPNRPWFHLLPDPSSARGILEEMKESRFNVIVSHVIGNGEVIRDTTTLQVWKLKGIQVYKTPERAGILYDSDLLNVSKPILEFHAGRPNELDNAYKHLFSDEHPPRSLTG